MKLEFVKLSPTQNMTVIVNSPLPRTEHADAAAMLMDYASVHAEQVGFREEPTLQGARARLQMMGGEFCGNASMCIAALAAREDGLQPGGKITVPIEISGADGVLECSVACTERGFECSVAMPLPEAIVPCGEHTLVRLPGIAHAVYECADPAALRLRAERMLMDIAKIVPDEAVGLMLYAPVTHLLLPLVYVRSTGSVVWERGCGSGSAAVGAYAAWKTGKNARVELKQPGGVITASAQLADDCISSLAIEGSVRIVCEGTAYI